MSLNVYINGPGRERRRPGPLAVSLLLHGGAFYALMNAPQIKLPEPAKSEYKLAIEGKETKLVWYKFDKKLPAVTPLEAKAERKPLRAKIPAPQEIVASRKDAPQRTQMVWTPAPELKVTNLQELPNILAIRLPEVTRPFVAPPEIQRPETAKVQVPRMHPSYSRRHSTPSNCPTRQKLRSDSFRLRGRCRFKWRRSRRHPRPRSLRRGPVPPRRWIIRSRRLPGPSRRLRRRLRQPPAGRLRWKRRPI